MNLKSQATSSQTLIVAAAVCVAVTAAVCIAITAAVCAAVAVVIAINVFHQSRYSALFHIHTNSYAQIQYSEKYFDDTCEYSLSRSPLLTEVIGDKRRCTFYPSISFSLLALKTCLKVRKLFFLPCAYF
ncbi:uncharacterized protein [Rutidosis leptorrhynchoides]|uniref:uncharacterized protein n=1 Tax=Rutidosis leptorrhynchoides TaxID=125765 RepID=UPI003A9A5AAB